MFRMTDSRTAHGAGASYRWFRPLASLFFDDVRDEPRRARDHENAVERGGIIPRSARMAPIAPSTSQRARRLHLHAAHGGFARKLEQACGARVLGVEAMTFCQRVGDNALQLSSLATVHESIREFPPLNDYSSR